CQPPPQRCQPNAEPGWALLPQPWCCWCPLSYPAWHNGIRRAAQGWDSPSRVPTSLPTSLQFSARLAEHSRQLAGVQNEYSFALVAASAHLEHYQRVELPAAMQALDGDLYERLREHLSAASRTEVETCRVSPQPHTTPLLQVCREQDLLLFLQDHPAFSLAPEQRFQLTGMEEVCLLPPADDGASLEKEARRWATRVAREHKNRAHSEEVGVVLPHGALGGSGRGEETPTGLDPAEFDDYEDSDEPDEDDEPGPAARTYPYTCRVIFGYQADELSISQGEELEIIEDGDAEEWVKARNKAGQVGYVPEKYLLSLGSPASCVLSPLPALPSAWLVRALYDYEGQSPEELSFPEGAIIRVLPRAAGEVDDGFWTGDFDGRVGVFPSLVVEELTGAREAAGQVEDGGLSRVHPAFALLGAALALQGVPLPPAAVDAGGVCGAQVHRVVMGRAPVLAAAVVTKAATEDDRLCHLGETSQPWCSPSGAAALGGTGMRKNCST
uniref:SH3 domain-containing protein n=1 Tax=Zonotrichia albicollis TaxID=44394 RepID=A0A8D2QBC4_ZONAL